MNPPHLSEPMPSDPAAVDHDATITRHLKVEPATLNPLFLSSLYDSFIMAECYSGLVKVLPDLDWAVDESVVAHWEESDDHLVWTFRLRRDLRFHDGEPVTGDDVRFTWKAMTSDEVKAFYWRSGPSQIEDIEVLGEDRRTIRITLKFANASSRWNFVFPILPEHVYGGAHQQEDPSLQTSAYYADLGRRNVGCGPFRFSSWEPGQRIMLERWEGYLGKKPAIRRVVFRIVSDPGQALNLFKIGELDELSLTPLQFATQTDTDDEAFRSVGVKALAPQWSYYFVQWNVREDHFALSDRRVRRALAHAVDLQRLIDTVGYGLFEICHGIFHPRSWMYAGDLQLLTRDPERARELLDEAGWKIDENDGWRYRELDGQRRLLELTLLIPAGSDLGEKAGVAIQSDLKRVGVKMNQQVLEFATIAQRRQEGDFDASVFGLSTGVDPDLSRSSFHSEGPRNFNGYSNPEVDRLFDLARDEHDQKLRAAHYGQIQRLVYEDQPMLFLFYVSTLHAFNKRIHGVQLSPRGPFGFSPGMRSWWIPAKAKPR